MNEKSIVQYAEVEQPFGSEPPLVHCPICGEAPLKENEIVPCKHLSFIFVGEVCEFEYKSDQFKEKISQINEDEISLDTLKGLLEKVGFGNEMLAIDITHGGMACGPVWFTDVYGFDYKTLGSS